MLVVLVDFRWESYYLLSVVASNVLPFYSHHPPFKHDDDDDDDDDADDDKVRCFRSS